MEINSYEASKIIKNKKHFYDLLAEAYYLPTYTSKAITKEYLFMYSMSPIPIYVAKKTEVVHHHYTDRKFTSIELLEKLEELLKSKKLNPTGLNMLTLPDQEWLCNIILTIDPEDPYGLLQRKISEQNSFTLKVNEE